MADEPERDDVQREPDDWEPPRRECRVVALDDEGREVPLPQRSISELLDR